MAAANEPRAATRGARLVLMHCDRLSRLDPERIRARDRLEAELGRDLARFLVAALVRDERPCAAAHAASGA